MTSPGRNRIEVYRDHAGEWRWRHIVNGEKTSEPGEGFTRRWSAKRSARREYPGVPLVVVK